MKFLRRIISHPNFWPLVIITAFALLASRQLFLPGYFNMHDDLQMMRQLEMEKCFRDGQIPCRWVPDMGYGFGFPLFNYYPPLPYLIGELLRVAGFSFVVTVKLTFILAFVASGITMYFLAKEFFGRFGGVISAVFYVWAPYHAVDVYVRGAMNEAWALIWFPLIFWTSFRLAKAKKNNLVWIIGLALAWVGLLTSHNLMVLILTPFFAVWCLILFWRLKVWRKIPLFIVSGIAALGLTAFFTLPAILEQKYVQVNTLVVGYYDFIAHYVTINQLLISRFWGYGPSVWGPIDGMSFQIGHIHWVLSLVILGVLVYRYVRTRKLGLTEILLVFAILAGWFAGFMTHSRSTPIWFLIPPYKFIQFPWRFLTFMTFAFSFIAGYTALLAPKRFKFIPVILMLILVVIDWNYFKPEKMGPLTDAQKFSGAAWDLQQTAGIYDYLPKEAETAPKEAMKLLGEVMVGRGKITNPYEITNYASFDADIGAGGATVRVGIFKFPGWHAFIDGKETRIFVPPSEKWGRLYLEIPAGQHKVSLRFTNTPLRTAADATSLVFWLGLLTLPLYRKRLKI